MDDFLNYKNQTNEIEHANKNDGAHPNASLCSFKSCELQIQA